MTKILLRVALPLIAAAVVLLATAMLGRWSRDSIRQSYTLPFASIQCLPVPGPEQKDLLAEVQYLAGLPDQLNVLDDGLADQLGEAFGRHPWVESVEGVRVMARRIEVRVKYRRPALAVRFEGGLRAVDGAGILLPITAKTQGLAVYSGNAAPPAGPAGTRWGDSLVEGIARAAAQTGGHE
jgi:hypothetical protein